MGFVNFPTPTPVFPLLASQAWSVFKKPMMASLVSIGATGREAQLARAAYPRWSFTLTFGWLREQTQNIAPDVQLLGFRELEQISGIYMKCLGPYGEFYFTDPDDCSRSGETVGVGDGIQTTWQLYYTWGNGPFNPPMTIPVNGINTIDAVYFNGVLQSSSLYGVDSTNTKIVFVSPPDPGVVITIDFHFYFRSRFLDDQLAFSQFAQNRWEFKELHFESVKP